MDLNNNSFGPFAVKDCALVAVATGKKAQNLRELRDNLADINAGCIYYHFWGGLLRPRFDDPQFNNDFAIWSHYALHDDTLAERLAVIDPTDYPDLEHLRTELIEIIEQRLEEIEWPTWVRTDRQFQFIRSQIVVFDTGVKVEVPEQLVEIVPKMSVGSIFYHFIDARRRSAKGLDDFRLWIQGFDEPHRELCDQLAAVDPYFVTLKELRNNIAAVLSRCFGRTES